MALNLEMAKSSHGLRLWFVNQYAVPPSQTGFTRTYDLMRVAKKHNVAPTVVTSSFNHFVRAYQGGQERDAIRQSDEEGVNFIWIKSTSYRGNSGRLIGMLTFALRVIKLDEAAGLTRPQAVIGSSPSPFAALGALLLAKKIRVPFVLEVRDIWPLTPIALGGYSRFNPVIIAMGVIERILYRSAKRIFCIPPLATDHLVSRGARKERIVFLPNGVNSELSNELLPLNSPGCFKFIYAGSHGLANNLDVILEAVCVLKADVSLKRFVVELYGDGPERIRLQNKAKRLGLTMVRFNGPLPKRQVVEKMKEADVFLMPLKSSPLFQHGVSPNKLYEYMSLRRPVLFAVETPKDPIEECRGGISLKHVSGKSVAAAMKTFIQMERSELREMGQRAYIYARENYSLEKIAQTLVNEINTVVKEA